MIKNCFDDKERAELKEIMLEVLKEYHRKMRMAYDDVKPLGHSYFDTEHFKHRIDESEPLYDPWQ